eukprot:TRINITY_DN44160_c0_g1_i1.p1 TRINITY_DN44160_c0_g1~~TRINITY_DN44160_c0_g1_i1.p1  ORF type:complete len:1892 (+),score=449.92 TRINITY_DN44160_c0_g1_i1:338-5677(+)
MTAMLCSPRDTVAVPQVAEVANIARDVTLADVDAASLTEKVLTAAEAASEIVLPDGNGAINDELAKASLERSAESKAVEDNDSCEQITEHAGMEPLVDSATESSAVGVVGNVHEHVESDSAYEGRGTVYAADVVVPTTQRAPAPESSALGVEADIAAIGGDIDGDKRRDHRLVHDAVTSEEHQVFVDDPKDGDVDTDSRLEAGVEHAAGTLEAFTPASVDAGIVDPTSVGSIAASELCSGFGDAHAQTANLAGITMSFTREHEERLTADGAQQGAEPAADLTVAHVQSTNDMGSEGVNTAVVDSSSAQFAMDTDEKHHLDVEAVDKAEEAVELAAEAECGEDTLTTRHDCVAKCAVEDQIIKDLRPELVEEPVAEVVEIFAEPSMPVGASESVAVEQMSGEVVTEAVDVSAMTHKPIDPSDSEEQSRSFDVVDSEEVLNSASNFSAKAMNSPEKEAFVPEICVADVEQGPECATEDQARESGDETEAYNEPVTKRPRSAFVDNLPAALEVSVEEKLDCIITEDAAAACEDVSAESTEVLASTDKPSLTIESTAEPEKDASPVGSLKDMGEEVTRDVSTCVHTKEAARVGAEDDVTTRLEWEPEPKRQRLDVPVEHRRTEAWAWHQGGEDVEGVSRMADEEEDAKARNQEKTEQHRTEEAPRQRIKGEARGQCTHEEVQRQCFEEESSSRAEEDSKRPREQEDADQPQADDISRKNVGEKPRQQREEDADQHRADGARMQREHPECDRRRAEEEAVMHEDERDERQREQEEPDHCRADEVAQQGAEEEVRQRENDEVVRKLAEEEARMRVEEGVKSQRDQEHVEQRHMKEEGRRQRENENAEDEAKRQHEQEKGEHEQEKGELLLAKEVAKQMGGEHQRQREQQEELDRKRAEEKAEEEAQKQREKEVFWRWRAEEEAKMRAHEAEEREVRKRAAEAEAQKKAEKEMFWRQRAEAEARLRAEEEETNRRREQQEAERRRAEALSSQRAEEEARLQREKEEADRQRAKEEIDRQRAKEHDARVFAEEQAERQHLVEEEESAESEAEKVGGNVAVVAIPCAQEPEEAQFEKGNADPLSREVKVSAFAVQETKGQSERAKVHQRCAEKDSGKAAHERWKQNEVDRRVFGKGLAPHIFAEENDGPCSKEDERRLTEEAGQPQIELPFRQTQDETLQSEPTGGLCKEDEARQGESSTHARLQHAVEGSERKRDQDKEQRTHGEEGVRLRADRRRANEEARLLVLRRQCAEEEARRQRAEAEAKLLEAQQFAQRKRLSAIRLRACELGRRMPFREEFPRQEPPTQEMHPPSAGTEDQDTEVREDETDIRKRAEEEASKQRARAQERVKAAQDFAKKKRLSAVRLREEAKGRSQGETVKKDTKDAQRGKVKGDAAKRLEEVARNQREKTEAAMQRAKQKLMNMTPDVPGVLEKKPMETAKDGMQRPSTSSPPPPAAANDGSMPPPKRLKRSIRPLATADLEPPPAPPGIAEEVAAPAPPAKGTKRARPAQGEEVAKVQPGLVRKAAAAGFAAGAAVVNAAVGVAAATSEEVRRRRSSWLPRQLAAAAMEHAAKGAQVIASVAGGSSPQKSASSNSASSPCPAVRPQPASSPQAFTADRAAARAAARAEAAALAAAAVSPRPLTPVPLESPSTDENPSSTPELTTVEGRRKKLKRVSPPPQQKRRTASSPMPLTVATGMEPSMTAPLQEGVAPSEKVSVVQASAGLAPTNWYAGTSAPSSSSTDDAEVSRGETATADDAKPLTLIEMVRRRRTSWLPRKVADLRPKDT